ncbi:MULTISPECIES: hypothetical protein [Pirellulaceae]|uniref:hypothetical protein n=1 Tax=Pirellulaceae TaxID=2691357 RepID=UPI0011B0A6EB|nr:MULTISPECIES: hypothetical protein [Pirellulaceae]
MRSLAGEIHRQIEPPRSNLLMAFSFRNRACSLARSQCDWTWESTLELRSDEKRSSLAIIIAMAMKFMRE